jgi:hypothetical protein
LPRRTRTEITSRARILSSVSEWAGTLVSSRKGLLVRGLALTVLCGVCAAIAQETSQKPTNSSPHKLAPYAVIFGTVWDPDSRPAYGVHVQLRRSGEKKVRWEAYSDHRGEFAFRVPPGKADYELAADHKSLKALKLNNLQNDLPVKVHVEYDEQVDTGLHLKR